MNPESTSNGQQHSASGKRPGKRPTAPTRLPGPPRAPTPSPAPYLGLPAAEVPYNYVPPVQVYSTPPTPEWTAPPEAYSSVAWNPTPPWTPMALPKSSLKDGSSSKAIESYFDPRVPTGSYRPSSVFPDGKFDSGVSHPPCPPDPAQSCLFAGSSVDPTKGVSSKGYYSSSSSKSTRNRK
ncbi:hypothetical protein NLJ89_g5099 [Agrocybe chaxingu]|uniref:Uncharacterized protein n=1 Tax=Agrocybe chaxingu TaxID=84603 RepID=A0A9W8K1M8_9AGAR|nr:hypothetical protein NLJ89_g5099 [Agrocybe chaxingu]